MEAKAVELIMVMEMIRKLEVTANVLFTVNQSKLMNK
jgi:hypothetical protein